MESGRSLRGTTRGELHRAPEAERKARDIVAVDDMPEVLITGCRADQTSADAAIGGGFAGALTYNLVEALAEAATPLSYRELHDQTSPSSNAAATNRFRSSKAATARLDQPFLSPLE